MRDVIDILGKHSRYHKLDLHTAGTSRARDEQCRKVRRCCYCPVHDIPRISADEYRLWTARRGAAFCPVPPQARGAQGEPIAMDQLQKSATIQGVSVCCVWHTLERLAPARQPRDRMRSMRSMLVIHERGEPGPRHLAALAKWAARFLLTRKRLYSSGLTSLFTVICDLKRHLFASLCSDSCHTPLPAARTGAPAHRFFSP
jgi:hypothetical protein